MKRKDFHIEQPVEEVVWKGLGKTINIGGGEILETGRT